MPWSAIGLLIAALLSWSWRRVAHAEPPRTFALVVGANQGGQGQAPLRYAAEDAVQVARLLAELGRAGKDDTELLLQPTPQDILTALGRLRRRLATRAQAGEYSKLIFYYSGHARARALSLQGGELPPREGRRRALRTLVQDRSLQRRPVYGFDSRGRVPVGYAPPVESYRRYGPALLRKARRLLRNEEDARDAIQSLFLELLQDPAKPTDLPYHYRVLTHRCLNLLRDAKNRARLLERETPALRGPVRIAPDALALGLDTLQRLAARVDEAVMETVIYRYCDEMGQEEIASVDVGQPQDRTEPAGARRRRAEAAGTGGRTCTASMSRSPG
jgi:RNA polymerase sigma-70 factor (ECF subfamily)